MADLLRLSGINKSYMRGARRLRILSDVSLTVGEGEIVAVVGHRYEGKTTLLEIAAGLDQPDSGEVWFGPHELGRMRRKDRERLWREEISWVSRRAGTGLEFEILDYVEMPLLMQKKPPLPLRRRTPLRDSKDVALAALERVGVQAAARQRWEDLSDWERVLVALAHAIVRKPRLMIIDDLIDGFGVMKTQEAQALLRSLAQELGCGVLMSASDGEATLLADRAWSFADGGLKLLSGEPDSNVVDFPGRNSQRSRGFSGSGS